MLVSQKELANLKLKSVKSEELKKLAGSLGIDSRGTAADLVKRLINVPQDKINNFIKRKYQEQVKERQKLISDEDLKQELRKVQEFRWALSRVSWTKRFKRNTFADL